MSPASVLLGIITKKIKYCCKGTRKGAFLDRKKEEKEND